jgi:hypothetical protein
MRRFVRRSFGYLITFIAACSALACAGLVVLWVRGYFVGDEFKYHGQLESTTDGVAQTEYVVASSRGRLALATTSLSNVIRKQTRSVTWRRDRPPVPISVPNPTPWGRFGFQFISEAVPLSPNTFILVVGVIVPSWFAVLLSAIPPGLWYLLWRRRHQTQIRLNSGQCVRCGYDLRETPGRCPECGAVSTPATVQP